MNEQLKSELLSMLELDKKMRYQNMRDPNYWDRETDHRNTERMKEIIHQYGFPRKSLVGDEAALAAWAIIQHSPDLQFQQDCLPLIYEAAKAGEFDMRLYAYLEDRVRLKMGHKQLYGSQLQDRGNNCAGLQPLDDSEDVHVRRANVGLEPLELNLAFYLARRYAIKVLNLDPNVKIQIVHAKPIRATIKQMDKQYTLEMEWNEEQKQLCVTACKS
jgi:hypothetical protein